MGAIDQALAKIYEAGGPTAAIGSQLGKDADKAFRMHHGVPLAGQEGRRQPAPAQDSNRLEKSAAPPDDAGQRFYESLDRLEALVKADPPKAKPTKAVASVPRPKEPKPTPRRSECSPDDGRSRFKVQSLDQAHREKTALAKHRQKLKTMSPEERSRMAANLLRSGRKLNEVSAIMNAQRLP